MDHSEDLKKIAQALVATGKGILAADESYNNIGKKFTAIGNEDTHENHRLYRQLMFTTQGINQYISGVIMFDETIRQKDDSGKPFPMLLSEQGIIPGIKVDEGPVAMPESPEEKVTEGLEGLPKRLAEYYDMGARFAKWRAVITIGKDIPTQACLDENAERLAEYALMCQATGIVPIVEPEVLMDGDNSIDRCEEVTRQAHKTVFAKLKEKGVLLEGILLKPNMICAGLQHPIQSTSEEIAEATANELLAVVPPEVGGIVFLSGGQSEEQATLRLNLIQRLGKNYPWHLTYSYGRALQNSELHTWAGDASKVAAAQKVFLHRCHMNSLAQLGKYEPEMDILPV